MIVFLDEEQEVIEPRISVFGVVRRLREQRYCMVQVQTQYQFIYEYVNQWIKDKGYARESPKTQTKPFESKLIDEENEYD